MSQQKKKQQRIYDLVNAEIIEVALWPPSNPNRNPLDYTTWGILENKINTTSHPNIGSLKTVIENEWNKISEEFILKACKSFQRHIDAIIEKIVAILSKFTVFCCLFFIININLV